tara:strand:- start:537 stop:680 length:144 start_codon:yes stop_codon:yes gene_type:complete
MSSIISKGVTQIQKSGLNSLIILVLINAKRIKKNIPNLNNFKFESII